MWKQVGLIGRDRFLKKHIYPRCKGKEAPFLLVGQRGVGKSAILEWAFGNAPSPKALISCTLPMREQLQAIARGWGLTVTDGDKEIPLARAKTADLEDIINKQSEGAIFVDDIDKATPTFLRRFKVWREKFQVFAAGVPPFKKEDLKRNLWGFKELELYPVAKEFREPIALAACRLHGSSRSSVEIAHASRGFPGRILAMSRGTVEVAQQRAAAEELDLSIVLIIGLCCLALFKYAGRGMDDNALYLLGSFGMVFGLIARMFLSKAKKD